MPKDNCSICGSEYDEEAGGIQGYFGICPVTFCKWCYSSIVSMVTQHLGIDDNDDDYHEEEKKPPS